MSDAPSVSSPAPYGWSWGGYTSAEISSEQAMRLSAVYACLRLLSEAVATLPLDTFIRRSGTRQPYRPRPDYLSFQPPQGSRVDYLSQVMLSLLTDGNAFVATPRDELGVPVTLVVIDPTQVTVKRQLNGEMRYDIAGQVYTDYDVMHIKGMSMPGSLRGLSPLAYARETIDLGLSAQRFGAAFFTNGALPGAVIEAPGSFDKVAAERFAESWNAKHKGIGNAQKVGVLTNGATLNKVSIAPNDAQFLETRAFQVPDIARIFGVPPHLIADASNSTSWGSGLAEQNLAFGQFSCRPWVDRVETSHDRLLTTHGLPDVFVRLNMDALLRAGTKERYEAHEIATRIGLETINEARKIEDMPPVDWGDGPPQTSQAPSDPTGGNA